MCWLQRTNYFVQKHFWYLGGRLASLRFCQLCKTWLVFLSHLRTSNNLWYCLSPHCLLVPPNAKWSVMWGKGSLSLQVTFMAWGVSQSQHHSLSQSRCWVFPWPARRGGSSPTKTSDHALSFPTESHNIWSNKSKDFYIRSKSSH